MSSKPRKLPTGIRARTLADGSTTYLVRVRRHGFTATETFPTLELALAFRAQAVAAAKGQAAPPAKPAPLVVQPDATAAVTVEQAIRRLCRGMRDGTIRNSSGRTFKPSVVRGYESDLRLHVLPASERWPSRRSPVATCSGSPTSSPPRRARARHGSRSLLYASRSASPIATASFTA